MTAQQLSISRKNKQLAWEHFYPEGKGKPKKGYVLHHVDITLRHSNIERYILWRIEDLMLMSLPEHTRLHLKGVPKSEEYKRKISEAFKGRPAWNKGKHLSEEYRKRLSEAHKGKHPSEETRKKISEAKKGHSFSEETRHKMSEAKQGHLVTEETRKKMSEAKQGHLVTEETRKKISESQKRRFAI